MKFFNTADGNWRGLGRIPKSGLEIKKKYLEFDAKIKYKNILSKVDFSKSRGKSSCRCAKILLGIEKPQNCPLFGKVLHARKSTRALYGFRRRRVQCGISILNR